MKLHGNARTCPKSRRLLVDRVSGASWSVAAAAEAAGVSERTAYRWLRRWREEGVPGLSDRSSAPRSIPHRTPADRVQAIAALRRLHMTAAEIAEVLQCQGRLKSPHLSPVEKGTPLCGCGGLDEQSV
jgi:transposase